MKLGIVVYWWHYFWAPWHHGGMVMCNVAVDWIICAVWYGIREKKRRATYTLDIEGRRLKGVPKDLEVAQYIFLTSHCIEGHRRELPVLNYHGIMSM